MSDWLVTCQQPVMDFVPGNTFYVCMGCLASLGLAWLQGQEPAEVGPVDPAPDGPGVLEQMEADDGPPRPAGRGGRARKSGPPEPDPEAGETVEQASPADVHG